MDITRVSHLCAVRDFLCARILATVLAVNFSFSAIAAPASFDSGFGSGGKLTYSVVTSIDVPYASALQSDGKIVIAGYCFTTLYVVCVSRVNVNGTLDTSFGVGGTYTGVVGTNTTTNAGVAVLPSGQIVFGGQCAVSGQVDFCLLRLSASGTLDATFGSGGVATTNFGATSDDLIFGINAMPDGTILAAGRCNGGGGYRFCMARYLSNGTLDNTFGASLNGQVTLSLSASGQSRGRAVVVQSDGKLLFSGNCDYSGVSEFCAARFSANGVLDNSFGVGGVIHTSLTGTGDTGIAAAYQADGKFVFAGVCNSDFCAARYLSDGSVDTTFGAAGFVFVNFGPGTTADFARAIAVQTDGKILIAGECNISTVFEKCLVRLNADGSLDLSFSPTGKTNFLVDPLGDSANSLLIQSDGRIVLTGQCGAISGTALNVCVARLEGGPLSGRVCSQDVDGDGVFLATTDALILTRIALGMKGNEVLNGISFSQFAKRTTWSDIRAFLVSQCGMSLPL